MTRIATFMAGAALLAAAGIAVAQESPVLAQARAAGATPATINTFILAAVGRSLREMPE